MHFSIKDSTRRLFCCFIPSYIQNAYDTSSSVEETSKRKLHTTASLDGLRGIAAHFVFFFHVVFSLSFFHEYGYGVDANNRHILQLPILRLVISGHAMVSIFFTVGGYVLSLKPLKQIHTGQSTAFLHSLVSSIFRRAIRLYAPAVIAMFLSMLTLYFGLWEPSRKNVHPHGPYVPAPDHHIERSPTFQLQLWHYLTQVKLLTNFFKYWSEGFMFPYYPHYDPHLWTIPVEFRSGMILALSLLAFSRCKTAARMILVGSTILFCILWDRWELVCFFSGSLLCEIDILTKVLDTNPSPRSPPTQSQPTDPEKSSSPILPSYHDCPSSSRPPSISSHPLTKHTLPSKSSNLYFFTFLLGLYLLSAPPQKMALTPGYHYLSYLIPSSYTDAKRFPHTLGALLVIYSLTRSPPLRVPFESQFAQYLGKISFSFYIVHGPVIHIVGFSVIPWIWVHVTGYSTEVSWGIGLVLGMAVTGAVVAIVADWFWRVIEVRSIGWASRFEKLCFRDE